MSDEQAAPASGRARRQSNAYDLFILVLTILSLFIMVALLLPLGDATLKVLETYDDLICVIFLIDFGYNLSRSQPKRDYFIH